MKGSDILPAERAQWSATIRKKISEAFIRSEALELPVALLIDTEALAGTETYVPVKVPMNVKGYVRNVAQNLVCPFLARYQLAVLQAKLCGGEWRSLEPPELPRIPEELPAPWQETVRVYQPFLGVFRKLRGRLVVGDTGVSSLFAFPPYDCVDMCTYMGGSIPLALGADLGGLEDAWAVTGDFSFIAAGHLGLVETLNRGIPLKVLILNNHQAWTTGGQEIKPGILDTILKGFAPFVAKIADPQDTDEASAVLERANEAEKLCIVVADFGAQRGA